MNYRTQCMRSSKHAEIGCREEMWLKYTVQCTSIQAEHIPKQCAWIIELQIG